ncbi:hypothetical protein Tco_1418102 [Tanacetum coccineum]
MKADFYPDVGLEQLVPDQFWNEEECKYDIAAMYGISHWWFQRQRFYIDRFSSEGDRRAVQTHMRILSVVRIEVFSMYGYNYMKKIILRRADLKEYVIAERDFKYMYPSDFEDLYLLNLKDTTYLLESGKLCWWKDSRRRLPVAEENRMRGRVIRDGKVMVLVSYKSYQKPEDQPKDNPLVELDITLVVRQTKGVNIKPVDGEMKIPRSSRFSIHHPMLTLNVFQRNFLGSIPKAFIRERIFKEQVARWANLASCDTRESMGCPIERVSRVYVLMHVADLTITVGVRRFVVVAIKYQGSLRAVDAWAQEHETSDWRGMEQSSGERTTLLVNVNVSDVYRGEVVTRELRDDTSADKRIEQKEE